MVRKLVLALVLAVSTSVVLAGTPAGRRPRPGDAGIARHRRSVLSAGRHGGYDVQHYDLAIRYAPATDALAGSVRIRAVATQRCPRSTSTSTA